MLATYGAICVNDTCKHLFIVRVLLCSHDENIFQMLDMESVFIAVLKQLCERLFLKLNDAKTIGARAFVRACVCAENERL